MAENRYYWLKLKRDFFKRHDIQIIEAMPNGKDYILFYLKLLCESVDHDGNLRFSDQIPYNEDMLSTITNTNVDIVRSAIKIFSELNMIEIFDDGTYYMNEVSKMLGSAANNDGANRVRRYREKQKQLASVTNCNGVVTQSVTNDNESKSIEKDIEIEKDIDSIKKPKKRKKKFTPPTLEEVQAYCKQRNNSVDPKDFFDYYNESGWIDKKGDPVRNWKQKVIMWERYEKPKNGTLPTTKRDTSLDDIF